MPAICPVCSAVLVQDTGGNVLCTRCAVPAATLLLPGKTTEEPPETLLLNGESATVPPATLVLPSPQSPTAQVLPETIGRFRIEQRLGEGAFGVVYRAFDPLLNRPVALKVVKPRTRSNDPQSPSVTQAEALREETLVSAILSEAQAAAGLRHSHIAPIFEVQAEGSDRYIASAFIPGQTLAARLKDLPEGQRLPVRDAVGLVRKLARALDYAHRHQVIHRDVKPGNILIEPDGEPVLVDFGLAARGEVGADQPGGTAAYMAPEQWRNAAVPASDQYSLGCLFFELLTGQWPFHGGEPGHFKFLHETQPAPSVREKNPAVPRDLAAICAKCLAKKPTERYASCAALADDLAHWESGEPVTARQVGAAERVAKWVRRNPVVSILAATVFLVLAVGLVASLVLTGWALSEKENATYQATYAGQKSDEAKEERNKAIGLANERAIALIDLSKEKTRADDRTKVAEEKTKEATAAAKRV